MSLSLCLLAALLTVSCSFAPGKPDRSLDSVKEMGVLRVGIDPSYPPFASVDDQDRLVGYDVDLAVALGRRLAVEVSFVPIDVGTIFDGLLARKFDLIVSAIPPYPELTRQISFSEPYFNAGQVLLVRRESPVSAVEGLVDSTLGVELGSAAEVEGRRLAKSTRGLVLKTFESPQAVLEQLQSGAVAAAATDRVTALERLAVDPHLRQVGQPLTFEPYVMATRRPDVALLRATNMALAELQKEGFLAKLEGKWLRGG